MSIFLMLLAPIWEWSKLTFFKPKIIKSSYFEFQKSYIPQRKLKTHEIRIQLEKIRITAKKSKNSQFSWHARGPQKISVFRFPKILKNIFQKWLYWDKSNSERNKVTNFGDPSPTHVETTDQCMVPGSYWPMPAWNRVKYFIDNFLVFLKVFLPAGAHSRPCNQSYCEAGIWGWLEDWSPPWRLLRPLERPHRA